MWITEEAVVFNLGVATGDGALFHGNYSALEVSIAA